MTAQTATKQAVALFLREAVTASDAGFKMVAAGSLVFIANHTAPKAEKCDPKVLTSDLKDQAEAIWKKSHANDMVNAAKRAARKVWDNKQLLATIAAEPSIEAAAVIVAAELKAIAAAHSPDGNASLRALLDALHPAAKEQKAPDYVKRAVTAIEKVEPTPANIAALEQALAMLRGQLAANEAQEQVEALADIQAMAKAS